MPPPPTTVRAYLASLPDDVRREVTLTREAINRKLPAGYEEGFLFGRIAWFVPHSIWPAGWFCEPKLPVSLALLGGRKHGVSVAFTSLYCDRAEWDRFQKAWKATGEELDTGISCVRFERAKPATLKLLADAVARMPVQRFLASYTEMLKRTGRWKGQDAKPAARKAPARSTNARPAARTPA